MSVNTEDFLPDRGVILAPAFGLLIKIEI